MGAPASLRGILETAFLDVLYLYSRYVKAGKIEKAACVCRKALTDASLSAVAHDQMRTVWEQLLAATRIGTCRVLSSAMIYRNPESLPPRLVSDDGTDSERSKGT